jgi:hypothetical protein
MVWHNLAEVDNWSGVSDPKVRRLENLLNQRAYREYSMGRSSALNYSSKNIRIKTLASMAGSWQVIYLIQH